MASLVATAPSLHRGSVVGTRLQGAGGTTPRFSWFWFLFVLVTEGWKLFAFVLTTKQLGIWGPVPYCLHRALKLRWDLQVALRHSPSPDVGCE